MFAILVVLMLVPSWSDGLLLKKCELKSQLEEGLSQFPGETVEDVLAKIVCTAEHISGFNTSLVTIGQLIASDEDYSSGSEELPSANTESENVFHENVVEVIEPFILPYEEAEDKVNPEGDEVQPEESVGHDDGQARKRRDVPPKDEGDGSWMAGDSSGEGSIEQYEGAQENSDPPLDSTSNEPIYYDTFEMLFGATDLPPEKTTEPVYYDTSEMLSGTTDLPPETKTDDVQPKSPLKDEEHGSLIVGDNSEEQPIDQFDEILTGPTDLPPKTTLESIYYDTYEMLYGHLGLTPDIVEEPIYYDTNEMINGQKDNAMISLDTPQDTTGHLESDPQKSSSENQTRRYGIFQLSERACNSGSSHSLNLCELDCSALTDDDITDDIACLITLNKKKMGMRFVQDCLPEGASQYFAECG